MKKVFTSLCAVFFLFILAHDAKAGNYYVVNGEPFSLTPADGSSSYYEYQWVIDPNETFQLIKTLNQASGGLLTHTFTDAIGSPKLHKISLGVLGELGGCLSNVVEHNIIVLPKVTLTLSADKTNFCTDKDVSANLTATLSVVTGLDTYGVTIGAFTWKNGNDILTGKTAATLVAQAEGTYTATVIYNVPTDGSFPSSGAKLLNCSIPGTVDILHSIVVPTLPSITLK